METIRRFQIWYKQTEDWYGSGNPGMPVLVTKYQAGPAPGRGRVWYKTSLFSYNYMLNEWSFRRIFSRDPNAPVVPVPVVPTSNKGPRSLPGMLNRKQYVDPNHPRRKTMSLFLFRVDIADYSVESIAPVEVKQTVEVFMEAENLSQASRNVDSQFGGWQNCRYFFIREIDANGSGS